MLLIQLHWIDPDLPTHNQNQYCLEKISRQYLQKHPKYWYKKNANLWCHQRLIQANDSCHLVLVISDLSQLNLRLADFANTFQFLALRKCSEDAPISEIVVKCVTSKVVLMKSWTLILTLNLHCIDWKVFYLIKVFNDLEYFHTVLSKLYPCSIKTREDYNQINLCL